MYIVYFCSIQSVSLNVAKFIQIFSLVRLGIFYFYFFIFIFIYFYFF